MAGGSSNPDKKQILDIRFLKEKYDLKIDGIIHIGAHLAHEHIMYLNTGVRDIIYFEPVKEIHDTLVKNISYIHNNFVSTDLSTHIFNFALGNENKDDVVMNVEKNDRYGCSSILEPSTNYNHIPFVQEKVKMRRLDDIKELKDLALSPTLKYNYLNLDVQGYELEVLKGASNSLESIDYIMCEINRDTTSKKLDYIGASLIDEVCNFLSKYNFELVEERWPGTSWGDGFFIKRVKNESI